MSQDCHPATPPHGGSALWLRPGAAATLTIQGVDGRQARRGCVLCAKASPVSVSNHLRIQIMVLDAELAFVPGSKVVLHYQQSSLPGHMLKLNSILSKTTQAILKENPRCIPR